MSCFRKCDRIGKEGVKLVMPLMNRWSGGRVVEITDEEGQLRDGDFWIYHKHLGRVSVEIKTEEEAKTENLYMETWSNYNRKEGWYRTCRADLFAYVFLDINHINVFELDALRRVADPHVDNGVKCGKEKPNKWFLNGLQKNDTRGVPVNSAYLVNDARANCYWSDGKEAKPIIKRMEWY